MLYGGSFARKEDARARARWIESELAAMRVPDLRLVAPDPVCLPTVAEIAERWKATRVGVAGSTSDTYEVNLGRIIPTLGHRAASEIRPGDIQGLIAHLRARPLKRETIRKTLSTFAMLLDFGEIVPNPVRHRRGSRKQTTTGSAKNASCPPMCKQWARRLWLRAPHRKRCLT